MKTLPNEGDIITIKSEKVKVLKHIQTRNPFTGEVECHHILTQSVRGEIKVKHVMFDT